MASFLHGAPEGNRFSGPYLNAWYAGLSQKTAIAEVAHHLRRQTIYEGKPKGDMTFRSYGAHLDGDNYIDIRRQQASQPGLCDPHSIAAGQVFGEQQRSDGRDGILYDSLRHEGGTDAVCFIPTKVLDVVQQDHFEIHVYADPDRRPSVIRLRD